MSTLDNAGKDQLISGIENDAKQEAELLLKKANEYAADRRNSTERKIKEIEAEAEGRIKKQVEEIEKSIHSSITVEKRRIALKVRDGIITKVMNQVREKLEKEMTGPNYKNIITDWIVEGIIGLNRDKAEVNASKDEIGLIDDKLLKDAVAKAKKLFGKEIKLTKAKGDPLVGQGVSLTAEDGKTAFNNQIKTRLLRYQSEIRKIIYDALFTEED